MCDPTGGVATMMILSAVAGVVAQMQSADAQTRSNKQQAANALEGRNANYNQLNLKASQEADAASQKINENNVAASESIASSRVSANENGITGVSVGQLLDNLSMKQAGFNQSVMENNELTQMSINGQRDNTTISANNTIASLKAPSQPDYLGAGLQIAKAGQEWKKASAPSPVGAAATKG